MFRAGKSGKKGGGKTNAHWVIEGRIVHSLCTVVIFIPSCYIITYIAGICIALTVGMRT